MTLRLCEIFYSLQGEGVEGGTPALFLRLAGCNLRCEACDTQYAWEGGEDLSLSQLLARLNSYPIRYLVVTGGEPLLQARALEELLSHLSSWTLALETNATLWEPRVLDRFHLITASPKLSSRGVGPFPHDTFSLYLSQVPPRLQVKLVVDQGDWDEVEALLERYPSLGDQVPLVIQPLERGKDLDDYLAKSRLLAEAFLERAALWKRDRVRFLLQIHKLFWWGRRGT